VDEAATGMRVPSAGGARLWHTDTPSLTGRRAADNRAVESRADKVAMASL
jgi:hypothetical protein